MSVETLDRMAREGDGRTVMISCELDLGLDWLLETIWRVRIPRFWLQISVQVKRVTADIAERLLGEALCDEGSWLRKIMTE